MPARFLLRVLAAMAVLALGLVETLPFAATPSNSPSLLPDPSPAPHYEQRDPTPDGTGRFFLGREIARVMGHQAADWLERPERIEEERPDLLHPLLALRPGMQVADIGAGTGYHSWRMAEKVGPTGKVHAVEIQPEMLELLAARMARRGVTNVVGVLGTVTDPRLPAQTLDLILMVDVYHEFDHPFEMLAALTAALRPGGLMAFVEFRGEQRSVPIKPLHKMTEAQVRKEAALHGLEWVKTHTELPWQHLILFRKGQAKP
ncbi:MAG: class I SAM-dependent methyltransferase [Verrucomicrobiales bacterium]|nr:class I SAM-dependent methyltransferase [Verrucomicrobiales bacterium]